METTFADTISTPLGILLIVVGAILALRVAKSAMKLLFLAVVAAGVYLWFGVDGSGVLSP